MLLAVQRLKECEILKAVSKSWTKHGFIKHQAAVDTVGFSGRIGTEKKTRGTINIEVVLKGRTIEDEYYANLSHRFSNDLKKKLPHLSKKVFFDQDNAKVRDFNKLGY